jgi:hypothetical protein
MVKYIYLGGLIMKRLLTISALMFSINGLAIETDVKNGDLGGGITLMYKAPNQPYPEGGEGATINPQIAVYCIGNNVFIRTPQGFTQMWDSDTNGRDVFAIPKNCYAYKRQFLDKED